ncbi:MAG: TIGR03032 family protein [Pirellulales bacterium]
MSAAPEQSSGSLITCEADDQFTDWLLSTGGTLAVTTYQAGKVTLIGSRDGGVSVLMRSFDKPLGLAVSGVRVALAGRHQVWLFANAPLLAGDYAEREPGRYDAIYLPRAAYFTGDLNVHDLAFGDGGPLGGDGLWLVNTRFSCLAGISRDYSFVPRWQPPFISELAPEDRCHLNGLAMVGGRPKYVTALGETDSVGGWRENKATGGVLVDVERNEVVLRGLSMPHSPRWHDGRLWLLDSGVGELCLVDPHSGERTVVCRLPGYLRGLCFVNGAAVVGLCQIRERHIFGGLRVQHDHDRLLCGLAVIDLRTGRRIGLFEFTGGCQELYDVQFLSGVERPMIVNLEQEAARQAFPTADFAYWLRESSKAGDTRPAPPADSAGQS